MRVNVQIKNVVTINTDEGLRENQPMVEITLEVRKGAQAPREIKFTEMLSTMDGMDALQIADHMAMLIEDYVKTAIKGQAALAGREWVEKSRLIGGKYTFDI